MRSVEGSDRVVDPDAGTKYVATLAVKDFPGMVEHRRRLEEGNSVPVAKSETIKVLGSDFTIHLHFWTNPQHIHVCIRWKQDFDNPADLKGQDSPGPGIIKRHFTCKN